LSNYINKSDIVFSLGRGIIEAMMCGRVPIVFDSNGGDGIVTSKNIGDLMKRNFSGRTRNQLFTKDDLVAEIKKYNKDDAEVLSKKALELYGTGRINNLVKIYSDAIKEFEYKEFDENSRSIVEAIFNSNSVSSRYTKVLHNSNYLKSQKHKDYLRTEIEKKIVEISEDLINDDQIKLAEALLEYTLNKINNKSLDAGNNLAVVKILNNKFDEAENLLGRILINDPQNQVALENLMFIKNNKKQFSSVET
jgi:tetratricopeptide (TPR) repeat protein